jgi:hypothetical protein
MKLDLLTNATVVDDAIRFVTERDRSKREWSYYQQQEEAVVEQRIANTVF